MDKITTAAVMASAAGLVALASTQATMADQAPPPPVDNPADFVAPEGTEALTYDMRDVGWVYYRGEMVLRSEFEADRGDTGAMHYSIWPASVERGYIYAFDTEKELEEFDTRMEADATN